MHATQQLVEAARSRGVTVNTLVQMAWAIVLSVFTDRRDVVFGVTVSGRPSELPGRRDAWSDCSSTRCRCGCGWIPRQRSGRNALRCNGRPPPCAITATSATPNCVVLAGVGEMFDTLLVYENFPPGGWWADTEFAANGATFRPAALESLSHFPVTIAAHLADDQLTVLVEVIDGALGPMSSGQPRASGCSPSSQRLIPSGTVRFATSAC